MPDPTGTVGQALARPARTAVQLVPAFVLTEAYDSFISDLSEKQYAAMAGLLLLVFSWLQVLVENLAGRGFLRKVPERPAPVVQPDPAPQPPEPPLGGDAA